MPNLFSGINTALRAILSHQHVIEVIEHNVANANTPGYRRQEAVLTPTVAHPAPHLRGGFLPGQIGTGVNVEYVRRINLEFFDGRLRREISASKRWSLQQNALKQIELSMAEGTEDGLVPKLDAFWSGWQALSDDPANMTARSDLKQRAIALSDALNWRAKTLLAQRRDQELGISERVDEVNALAAQIAQLNVDISNISAAGDGPNDLLDDRDRALDRLAELAGSTANLQDNGQVLVSIGGHALVMGSSAFTLSTVPNPGNNNLVDITWNDTGDTLSLQNGELAGLLEVRDQIIPSQLDGLNTLANELVNQVNTLHRSGFGLNNATNLDFFAPLTTTDYALEIHVSDNLNDLNNIAAASAVDSPGDGNHAVAIANIRNQAVLTGNTQTLNQFYTKQIGDLGLSMLQAQSEADNHAMVADSLNSLRESVSGVSLDEEAANMVRAQRSFQAAARLMTTVDDMIDRIISGMGVVGR